MIFDSISNRKFSLIAKKIFIKWYEIECIKIFNKEEKLAGWISIFPRVKIVTSNNKYDISLNNPRGFVKALKDLKKFDLLSKDSKYIK